MEHVCMSEPVPPLFYLFLAQYSPYPNTLVTPGRLCIGYVAGIVTPHPGPSPVAFVMVEGGGSSIAQKILRWIDGREREIMFALHEYFRKYL